MFVGSFLLSASFYKIKETQSAFANWQQALNLYDQESYKESLSHFDKAYPVLHTNGDFLMNYGKTLVLDSNFQKAKQVLCSAKAHLNTTVIETSLGDAYKGLKQYPKAEAAYQHAANMVPNLFYPDYLLAILYKDTNEKTKAYTIAKEILQKEIKVPSDAIKQIQREMTSIVNKQTH